ncbi:FAD-dependent hydroxylase [Myxacorys almedinensis]|uniref:FAD-dependent hydroxylase n=1 Tax=Myxacorys almedinensis A TaxID=2690445 RepID=A0A8J7Z1U7_9CYAN|nr:FAD-dependent hydroxylase [Myxacorys almedinensis]NDJ18099.1 FAD-dependent hydroxylase [Myxacorys almedinensis A]
MALEQPVVSQVTANRTDYDYDLMIVGGGIVGTLLACALKDSNLSIALIEAETHSQAVAKAQAYSITLLSSQILQGLGVWDTLRPQIETYNTVRLSDAAHPSVVQFLPTDIGTQTLGYVAEHRVLLATLQAYLDGCSNVHHLCPAKVVQTKFQTDGAILDVAMADQNQSLRTRLVIAADGSRSPLRQQAKIRTYGWKYWQACVVATFQLETPHNNTAYEWFWEGGPSGILPLPNNRCRIVWTVPKAEAETMLALSEGEFTERFTRRYGAHFSRPTLEGDRYAFPVQLLHSSRYVCSRLALIGDAAHCCHPLGGQGINMGIRDAAALAQVLQTACDRGEDIASLKVLKRYERWRQWENLMILSVTDLLNRAFSTQLLPVVFLRRVALHMLQTIQPFKSLTFRLMSGLIGRTPHLAQR